MTKSKLRRFYEQDTLFKQFVDRMSQTTNKSKEELFRDVVVQVYAERLENKNGRSKK